MSSITINNNQTNLAINNPNKMLVDHIITLLLDGLGDHTTVAMIRPTNISGMAQYRTFISVV
jgi:hypothetical protein